MSGNDIQAASGAVHIESVSGGSAIIASLDYFEVTSTGNSGKFAKTTAALQPTQGFWNFGDVWNRWPQTVGSSLGGVVTNVVDTTTTAGYAGGVAVLAIAAAVNNSANNTVGILLASGGYHWATCTNYAAGNMTISPALPSACNNGALVRWHQWSSLANL